MNRKNNPRALRNIPATVVTAVSLACMSLVAPACGVSDDTEQATARGFSGEELFAGIIFDVGPASGRVAVTSPSTAVAGVEQMTDEEFDATLLRAEVLVESMGMDSLAAGFNELEGKKSEVLSAPANNVDSAEITALVISMINAEDPYFFEDFAERIQSGDHYLVAEAMAEAGDKALTHTLALGLENVAPVDADQGFCIAVFVFIVHAVTIASAVNVAVAVNVAAVANVTVTVTTNAEKLAEQSMETDVFIDDITVAYAL